MGWSWDPKLHNCLETEFTACTEVSFGNDIASSGSHSEIHVRQWSENCENSRSGALIVTDNGLWVSLLMSCPRLKISWIHLLQENKTIRILRQLNQGENCLYVLLTSSKCFFSRGFQDNDCEPDTVPRSMMHPRIFAQKNSEQPNQLHLHSNFCQKNHAEEGSLKGGKGIFSVSAKYGNP